MPSASKAQQKFMGMVHALQKGDIEPSSVSKSVKDVAKNIKKSDAKDFASTKHKGLPKKVKEQILNALKEYANKMSGNKLGGGGSHDYAPQKGLRDDDGYEDEGPKDESVNEGMFSTIDQIRQDSKDVRDFIKKVFADRDFKDMKNDKEFLKYLKSIYEGVDESKGVPQNYMQGRTSDYHTALRGKNKDYSGGTNFKKTNHGQPDIENDDEDQETNQLNNKQTSLKAESFDKVEHLKLLNLALRAMPGSQKQKEIIRKLNQVRKAGGMRPLKETSIIEYGQRLDLSFIEDEDARLDGTPKPKDAINRDLDEGTMIRRAVDLAQEILPKNTWSRYASDGNKNKEFVKSIVRDLAQLLNKFYKSHDVDVRIKEEVKKK